MWYGIIHGIQIHAASSRLIGCHFSWGERLNLSCSSFLSEGIRCSESMSIFLGAESQSEERRQTSCLPSDKP